MVQLLCIYKENVSYLKGMLRFYPVGHILMKSVIQSSVSISQFPYQTLCLLIHFERNIASQMMNTKFGTSWVPN